MACGVVKNPSYNKCNSFHTESVCQGLTNLKAALSNEERSPRTDAGNSGTLYSKHNNIENRESCRVLRV
jgi:hypothetical protein